MCDLAKIADLVLLVVDGHFGFEMETFEFLNMCQARRWRAPSFAECSVRHMPSPLSTVR